MLVRPKRRLAGNGRATKGRGPLAQGKAARSRRGLFRNAFPVFSGRRTWGTAKRMGRDGRTGGEQKKGPAPFGSRLEATFPLVTTSPNISGRGPI